ncbi:MAG: hypothetical protein B6D41_12240 [Chloroflexi bacterium UTCFX4]|jgi:hypothetical protein|nr:MAG: hypothetical protein B6D41_12240 [Chloroflexi bacterium UTCFX4]
MGYTHYWRQRRDITATEWDDVRAAFNAMLAQNARILADVEDTDNAIAFNGTGEDSHETFVLNRALATARAEWNTPDAEPLCFQFCKTAHKPYDLIVTALLLVTTEIAPGWADVSSDGDMQGKDWQPARDFLRALKSK